MFSPSRLHRHLLSRCRAMDWRSIACPTSRRAVCIDLVDALLSITVSNADLSSSSKLLRIRTTGQTLTLSDSVPIFDRVFASSLINMSFRWKPSGSAVGEHMYDDTSSESFKSHMSHMSDHPLSSEIEALVKDQIGEGKNAGKIADEVMKLLDREKLLYYSDPGRVPVMNSNGRVLLAILEDPGITQRALAVYLRMSESAVQKCVRLLLKDGVIIKKMSGKRNHYEFNKEKGLSHPDVSRLLGTLLPLLSGSSAKQRTLHQQ